MVMKAATQPEVRTIAAGEFKAKCLKLMDEALITQRAFAITKRGRRVGKFVPEPPEEKLFRSVVGRSPKAKVLGDIISPLPQEWTLPEWARDKPNKPTKRARNK
jgi:hypothetical protein